MTSRKDAGSSTATNRAHRRSSRRQCPDLHRTSLISLLKTHQGWLSPIVPSFNGLAWHQGPPQASTSPLSPAVLHRFPTPRSLLVNQVLPHHAPSTTSPLFMLSPQSPFPTLTGTWLLQTLICLRSVTTLSLIRLSNPRKQERERLRFCILYPTVLPRRLES